MGAVQEQPARCAQQGGGCRLTSITTSWAYGSTQQQGYVRVC